MQGGKESQTRGKNLYLMFRKVIKLHESKRQEGDDKFKDLLHKLAGGGPLEDRHYKLMETRSFKNLEEDEKKEFWKKAVYICALNVDLVPFNIERYRGLCTPVAVIQAVNTGKGSSSASPDTAGGLLNYIILCVGGKVLLKSKLWQEAGLVNGADGVVKRIIYKPGNAPPQLPDCVLVHFDHYEGPPLIQDEPKLIPVIAFTSTWIAHKEDCSRTQIPLVPGDATTIHVTQGETLEKAIVNLGKKEFACGISYTGISRVRSLKDLIFYPEAPTHMRMDFMRNKPFREKQYEDERLGRWEEKFLNEVMPTIPKPNYENPDDEAEVVVDSDQSKLMSCLNMLTTHDQLKHLVTGQPSHFSNDLVKDLENIQMLPLKISLEQQDVPRLLDIARNFHVIGIQGDNPQKKNVLDKIVRFIGNLTEEEQLYNIKKMQNYLRFVTILMETEGKILDKEHEKKTRKECNAHARVKGITLKQMQRVTSMRKELVSLLLENKLKYSSYLREMQDMKKQIMEKYCNTNQSPQLLASTILTSIFSSSDIEIGNDMHSNIPDRTKKNKVQDKLSKAERPVLEDALKYLLGLPIVPRCLEDKDIKEFLAKHYLFTYVFFYFEGDLNWWKKQKLVQAT